MPSSPRIVSTVQTGIVGFHHHVEQDDGHLGFAAQQGHGLAPRIRMQQLQRPAGNLQSAQGVGRGLVHILVIIDGQHPPRVRAPAR